MSNKKTKHKEPQFDPYQIDKLARIHPSIKIGFLKFWIIGAAFYMVVYGLPQRFDYLDRMVLFWLVLVLMIEYIGNSFIMWMNTPDTSTLKYLPHEINRKSVLSLFGTSIYVLVMLLFVHFTLNALIALGIPTIGDFISESSLDPFTVAFTFLVYDYIWISLRGKIQTIRRK